MSLLTETRTKAPSPAAPAGADSPASETDKQFEEIAKNFAVIDLARAQKPDKNRITVMLDLPHLKKYGRDPTRELVYGCDFMVAVGDLVSCPPTPRGKNKWTTGMVIALDGGNYRGRVKFVRKIKPEQTPESENQP